MSRWTPRPATPSVAVAALLVAVTSGPVAAQPRSAYTDLGQTACRLLEKAPDGEGGDWARFECAGFGPYRVLLDYDDLRESLRIETPTGGYRLAHGIASFNRLGPKLEWRYEAGARDRPYAVIFRVYAQRGSNDPERSFLFVARTRLANGCIVARVAGSAKPNANVIARRLADTRARRFNCGLDARIDVE